MSETWCFYRQQPTDPIHNPIAGEFFSTEAVGNVAEALVREAVQNTLDARRHRVDDSRESAHAVIFVSNLDGALPPSRAQRWFGSLWPHVGAPGNGLRNQPTLDRECPFLVFEDFGTIGLTGDPSEHRVLDNVTNHFLNFFRAEGHSDKGEKDRGSWGVGKTVFPRASRVSSFLGMTVRSDDERHLLLGRSILKYHRVNGESFKSDGYFGTSRRDRFILPTDDPTTLTEFRRDFRIRRRNEPGLSIVVPWYEVSGDDALSRDKVVAAVLRGFFFPILMGHLSVTISAPDKEIALRAASIVQEVEAIGGDLSKVLVPMIRLAEWAQARAPEDFHALVAPGPHGAQSWSPELVPSDIIRHVRQSLSQRQKVALRVPMSVQFRSEGPRPTFFNIFLEHSDEDVERPVFIRDELIISDVRSPRTPQVRSLVIVEDGPLANLLRDAETPAHTQWNPDTGNFKNKYKFGPGAIKFVRSSVSELLRIVNQSEEQPDPTITIDFFSIPIENEEDEAVPARRRKPRPRPGTGPDAPPPPPPPKPRRYRIDTLRGGFAIHPGQPGAAPPPFYLDIHVAYDVRRGNPLRKYHPADFDLNRAPITRQVRGVEIKSTVANRMLALVTNADFSLEVAGFDTDRDLYVRADPKEAADVD